MISGPFGQGPGAAVASGVSGAGAGTGEIRIRFFCILLAGKKKHRPEPGL